MALVTQHANKTTRTQCCQILALPRSTYYRRLRTSSFTERYQHLKPIIRDIITTHPGYGYRRIYSALKRHNITVNHKLLKKLLKHWKLALPRRIKKKRRSGIAIVLSELGAQVNIVKQIPGEIRTPLMVQYTDFTEIQYEGGKAYLIPYVDDVTKIITGYELGTGPDAKLALGAQRKAVRFTRRCGIDLSTLYMHQDQGSAFISYEYVAALASNGITPSYSRKATPGDNAAMESFFGRLKDEWGQQFRDAETFDELQCIVKQALRYYNHNRIHSALSGMTPHEFLTNHLSLS